MAYNIEDIACIGEYISIIVFVMIPKRVTAEDIYVIRHHPIVTLSGSLLC